FTSLKKLRPQSVTSRIQPGSDVIVCAEMDEQWGYVGAKCKRLVRTVLIFTESSDQLSRATDRVPGLPASPGYVQ
ncbi:IS1 family transposase, partial [Salmonella enterica subsp. enterica serovar Give]